MFGEQFHESTLVVLQLSYPNMNSCDWLTFEGLRFGIVPKPPKKCGDGAWNGLSLKAWMCMTKPQLDMQGDRRHVSSVTRNSIINGKYM